jgi:hypothetical protein
LNFQARREKIRRESTGGLSLAQSRLLHFCIAASERKVFVRAQPGAVQLLD